MLLRESSNVGRTSKFFPDLTTASKLRTLREICPALAGCILVSIAISPSIAETWKAEKEGKFGGAEYIGKGIDRSPINPERGRLFSLRGAMEKLTVVVSFARDSVG